MRTFQRLANQSGERHGNDDGENRVHRARSRFRRKRNRRSLRCTARKHRRNVGLCEIQHNVCQAAADARHNAARYGNGKVFLQHVAGDFTLVRDEAANRSQQELKYKRKRSRSDVRRVRQVVEHRADAGSQTASDRAHHKARKQAKRVAEVDTGNIAHRHRNREAQVVGNEHQRAQKAHGDNLVDGILVFHFDYPFALGRDCTVRAPCLEDCTQYSTVLVLSQWPDLI